jgi:hypothetical protein
MKDHLPAIVTFSSKVSGGEPPTQHLETARRQNSRLEIKALWL